MILLLTAVRFYKEETKNDDEFAKKVRVPFISGVFSFADSLTRCIEL